ncbi:DUF975 family protein [[Clostridium] fimetarium]|uniref:DUF975 family protein n=1 Tax=[Clostridium] fimetarium TaxID=99656 RepID=A0A1I0R6F5_9FIRM|nr:DUF975 family protein [[Clostridium] fimetarium]SEW36174.1 Protein of unknown function [[Clostridium] fimetarium]
MWSREELKSKAKESFYRNYWKAVLVALFSLILTGGLQAKYTFDSNHSFPSFNNNSGNSSDLAEVKELLDANGLDGIVNNALQKIPESDRVAVIVAIIVVVIVIVLIAVAIGLTLGALLINPLIVGIKRFFVQDLDHKANIGELTYAFDNHYKNIVITMFFKNLFIFFWTLLLIIPGIIKAYEYRMIDYILSENPDMERHNAFALSKEMMTGQKWNAFVLDLSFLGWDILSLFTIGLLSIFYVAPYQNHTNAALYDALKNEIKNGAVQ